MNTKDMMRQLNKLATIYQQESDRCSEKNVRVIVTPEIASACRAAVKRIRRQSEVKKTKNGYPENLMLKIGLDPEKVKDPENVLEDMLVGLPEREQEVLELRYIKSLTLEETAKPFDLTRERIRQIEAKALKKLQNSVIAKDQAGINSAVKLKKIAEAELLKAADELKAEAAKLQLCTNAIRTAVERAGLKMQSPSNGYLKDMNITIEDLGLSSRAYNCMVHAGYKKASDLAGITIKDLKNIRNLGNRTVNEIVGKLVMYGVEIPEK